MLTAAGQSAETPAAAARGPVVVCGTGAAGLAAALSAARGGADVLLVEREPELGGTVTHALIHTLGGLFDSIGQLQNDGLPAELVERLCRADDGTRRRRLGKVWVLSVCPNVYRRVAQAWIAEQPRIAVLRGQVARVERAGSRLVAVEIAIGGENRRVQPGAVIDATGTAAVTRLIDPSLVIDDGPRSAGGWIFRLRGVAERALEFPKGVGLVRDIRAAAAAGQLPQLCAHAWLDQGVSEDEAFVKLMVPLGPAWTEQTDRISREAAEAQAAVTQFLRQQPDFAHATVTQTGCLGVRDGGRVRGRYVLSVDDVRKGRSFSDAACRGSWPIEYWDAERGVSVEYLPGGTHYEIPLRSLQIAELDNFWVAGKCLSADRSAHASARVAGTCWAMGQAVGSAAAASGRRD